MSPITASPLQSVSRLDGPTSLILSHADDRAVRRAVDRGELVRLAHGCHVEASAWKAAGWDERFRLRIRAARQIAHGPVVLSHAAAAFVWDLPWIGPWPDLVDITDPTRASTRSGTMVRCHAVPLAVGDIVEYHGAAVTEPARTVADIALTNSFAPAVAIADGALHDGLTDVDALCEAIARRGGARRFRSAGRVIDFADPLADSAAESVSRVTIHRIGAPRPVLQRRFASGGSKAYVDFWWDAVGVGGECDGDKKYLRPEFRNGRTIEQVILDEKKRGDWLLCQPEMRRLAHWGWKEANREELLAHRILSVGVPLGRRRRAADPW